ncbi:UNVERIFIED_CONTAM: hypothetical protein K2H54_026678 [Gekko kuhli]
MLSTHHNSSTVIKKWHSLLCNTHRTSTSMLVCLHSGHRIQPAVQNGNLYPINSILLEHLDPCSPKSNFFPTLVNLHASEKLIGRMFSTLSCIHWPISLYDLKLWHYKNGRPF